MMKLLKPNYVREIKYSFDMIKHFLNKIHFHKWQKRGVNRYGTPTYRVCVRCDEAQERVNNLGELDKWLKCEHIEELDNIYLTSIRSDKII